MKKYLSIFFLSLFILVVFVGCKKEELSSNIVDWINDTSVTEITFVNNHGEKKNISVAYTREMADTPSPFTKSENAALIYKLNEMERLELYFTRSDISFLGWCPQLGGQSALTIDLDKTERIIEGEEHLVIERNFTIGGAIYDQVAIFSLDVTAKPTVIKKYYYSKHNGLISILDTNDEMWVR